MYRELVTDAITLILDILVILYLESIRQPSMYLIKIIDWGVHSVSLCINLNRKASLHLNDHIIRT